MSEPTIFASLYIDEDITDRLAIALRQRGFNAIAAHEADLISDSDETHLAYAAEYKMILLTSNRDDFIRLAREWVVAGRDHYGIVVAPQFSNRQFGELLRLVLNMLDQVMVDDLINTVCFLTSFR